MFGSLTVGSAVWGKVAAVAGLETAHFIAAGGAVLGVLLTAKLRLPEGPPDDLTPSCHWPSPVAPETLLADDPPVMVELEYRLAEGADRTAFVRALEAYSVERRRDGAYSWAVYQDTADAAVYREVFLGRILERALAATRACDQRRPRGPGPARRLSYRRSGDSPQRPTQELVARRHAAAIAAIRAVPFDQLRAGSRQARDDVEEGRRFLDLRHRSGRFDTR